MSLPASNTKVEVVATFPPGSFLENVAGSTRNGVYVTCLNRQQLYWLPPYTPKGQQVYPRLIETYDRDQWVLGIISAPQNPNVYYILTSDFLGFAGKKSYLRMFNTQDVASGLRSQIIMEFPPEARVLNGLCALSESVLIAADSFASCIWRVDLDLTSFPKVTGRARKWYSHPTMDGKFVLPDFQPGTNGLKYSARAGYAYYTSTQQRLVCRVCVDPQTLDPVGDAEVLADDWQWDDLIIDDREGRSPVAYVTTHRDNSIVRVPLDPNSVKSTGEEAVVVLQGSDESLDCIGPTSGVWEDGCIGKSALFLIDGGVKNPPSGGLVRHGKIIRVELNDL